MYHFVRSALFLLFVLYLGKGIQYIIHLPIPGSIFGLLLRIMTKTASNRVIDAETLTATENINFEELGKAYINTAEIINLCFSGKSLDDHIFIDTFM
jgi:hypothetical protein